MGGLPALNSRNGHHSGKDPAVINIREVITND
jgi:hypothetical protein